MKTLIYKNYKLEQSNYNYHYSIFDINDQFVFHCSCEKQLTDEEKKEAIDHYILLSQSTERFVR